MRVDLTDSEGVKEEHPFDEPAEKIIEVIEHEPTLNLSESRDDNGMQQNTKERDPSELLISLSSWTDRSTTKSNNNISNEGQTEKIEWRDELVDVFTEARNEDNLKKSVVASKPEMRMDDPASLYEADRTSYDETEEDMGLMSYLPSESFETTTDETEIRKLQSSLEHGLMKLLNKAGVSYPPNASAEEIRTIFEREEESIRRYLDIEEVNAEKKASKKKKSSKKKKKKNLDEGRKYENIEETREDTGLMNYLPDESLEKVDEESDVGRLQNDLEVGLKKLLDKAGVSYPSNASGDEIKDIFEKEEEAIKEYFDGNRKAGKDGKVKKQHKKKNKKSKKKKSLKSIEESNRETEGNKEVKNYFDDVQEKEATEFADDANAAVTKIEDPLKERKSNVRSYQNSQFETFAPELLQKEESFDPLKIDDKYAIEDDISMLTEDMHSFREARAEIGFLKPESIAKVKLQGQRQGKPLQGDTVVTQQDDFITKVVCVASTPQLGSQTATPGINTSPFGRPTSAVFHEIEQKQKKKSNQTFESEIFSELAQFAELPNAVIQAMKSEAIGGDIFSQAGGFASMTPQNNKRQSQSTTQPISFNPGMAQSLVPVTAILQRSNPGNAIIPLAPMMQAMSKIMTRAGKKIMRSEVVDETIGLVNDIQWALGTDDFSCNFGNSDTESDSYTDSETLQSDLRSLEKGLSGYSQKGLSSIYESAAQNFDDDISNSESSYSRSSYSRSSYSRVSYSRSQASYARSRAASRYANNEERSTCSHGASSHAPNSQQASMRSHGASSYDDSRAEALLKEKEALEDAIADLRAQKSLLEMNAKLNAERELMEMNAELKAEKEALERSVAESASVYSHTPSNYMQSNCDATLNSHTPSSYMRSNCDASVNSHSPSEYGVKPNTDRYTSNNRSRNGARNTRDRRNSKNFDGQASILSHGASSYGENSIVDRYERRMVPYGSSNNLNGMVRYSGSSESDHELVPYDFEGRGEESEDSESSKLNGNPMLRMMNESMRDASDDLQAKISRVHDVVKMMLNRIVGYDPANETAIVLHDSASQAGELGSLSGAMVAFNREDSLASGNERALVLHNSSEINEETKLNWNEVDKTVRQSVNETVDFLGGIIQDGYRVC